MVKAVRKVHRWYSRTDERMWRRNSCTDERMRRRKSCTDDRGTKVVAKAVKRVHRGYSRTDERMRRRSSCTDDRGTKAVATEVRKVHRGYSRTDERMWRRNSGTDERMRRRNSCTDDRGTKVVAKAVRKGAPRILSHWWKDATTKLLQWWSRDEGSGNGSQKDAPMVVEQGLRRREEQSSGLNVDSRRLINNATAKAPVPTAARWRRRIREQSYAPMVAERWW